MKLKSIAIVNFRQFWKEVKIHFSCDELKNVTVIHGANGAGKTSLLNAFKWCFYGKTDFDTNTENILNESAIQAASTGEDIELKVIVIFEDQGCTYEVKRSARYIKKIGMETENLNLGQFNILKTGLNGETYNIEAPHAEINKVLPETLQPYFFFNGERIEKLAGVNESAQIKEAIKRLMGLKQVERAQRHLKKVSKLFRAEAASQQGIDSKNLAEKINALESALDEQKQLQARVCDDLKRAELSIESLDKRLETHKEVRFLQETRKSLNNQNEEIEDQIIANIEERKNLLDRNRTILLAKSIVDKCGHLVDENRKKGVLPYKVRAPFIDDLISSGTCICGRHLDESSSTALEEAKVNAGNDDLDSAYASVTFFIKGFESRYKLYQDEASKLISKNRSLSEKFDANKTEMLEISARIQNSDDHKITELENRRKELDDERAEYKASLKLLDDSIPSLNQQLNTENKLWDKEQKKQEIHNLTQARLESTERIYKALELLNQSFTETVREDLSNKVGETFKRIIRKNMNAFIDNEFRLRVEKQTGSGSFDAKEQSTGEKQVTSLSFISSIISLAKEKHASGGAFFKGGLYPLVMDSPFGALDDDYRLKVAENISELADQVIIFVSNSQWNGNVKKACEDKVGNHYRLVHYSNSRAANSLEHQDFLRYSEMPGEYSVVEKV